MAIPEEINNKSFLLTTTESKTFEAPKSKQDGSKRQVTKTFKAYVELGYQSKHDEHVRAYCMAKGIEKRNKDGTQVPGYDYNAAQGAKDIATFYKDRGETAIDVALADLKKEWGKDKTFADQEKKIMAVQAKTQDDGWKYDMSFYYCGNEIYVTYHTYPA